MYNLILFFYYCKNKNRNQTKSKYISNASWQFCPLWACGSVYDKIGVNSSNGKLPHTCMQLVLLFPLWSLVPPQSFHKIFRSVWQSGKPGLAAALQLCATNCATDLKWVELKREMYILPGGAKECLFLMLILSMSLSFLPVSAQCHFPRYRSLQDVPSHGHTEAGLWLPGQHQVRALWSPRYPSKCPEIACYFITVRTGSTSYCMCDWLSSI